MSCIPTTNMGLGMLGQEIRFIRKFRWFMSGRFGSIEIPAMQIKLSGRPSIDAENNHYITTTIFEESKQLYEIAATHSLLNQKSEYKKTSNYWIKKNQSKVFGEIDLMLYDGCGCLLETWKLNGVLLSDVNFGELDYTSSEENIVEFGWKYASCEYVPAKQHWINNCKATSSTSV